MEILMLDDFEATEVKPKRARSWIAALVSIAIVGGGLTAGYFAFRDAFEGGVGALISRFSVEDYDGNPGPPVVIVIEAGDTGEDVARKLVEADVIKSFDAIYRDMLNVELTIYPGHFEFPTQIPGLEALQILLAGENRVVVQVTIPEGLQLVEIVSVLVTDLGLSEERLLEAIEVANAERPGETLEGWLFPASYTFDPGVDEQTVISTMLARMDAELEGHGVGVDEGYEYLTLASIIQLEGRAEEDMYKISTVFNNRLDRNIALQSDPTVKYYY
ncbi:MAG: endolytic transglycosylase MltG, partial [Actinobacteria bacterium]|nr:endolytic transglycosylase MltG [Actinomycetota bacterium]